MRILIAYNDPRMSDLLKAVLTGAGHDVILAENGRIAWETWQQEHIKLIITEWTMPEMDGPELIRRIRAASFPGYTYIIFFVDAVGTPSDIIYGLEAGADDCLNKPFSIDELRARVRSGERILNLEASMSKALAAFEEELSIAKQDPLTRGRRLRVFLCHASGDKPAVRELYRRLKSDHLDPWLDEENLLPGQNWQVEITKAVQTADVVVVCLSSGSVNKAGYVQKEIKYALDRADELPDDSLYVMPLRLEDCEVPARLKRWHWVDMFASNGYTRLVSGLRLHKRLHSEVSVGEGATYYQPRPEPTTSVLFLVADPTDAARLRLGEELREIQEKLQLAQLRDQFKLHQRMSARPADISQAMLDVRPRIVHFSGHGTASGELCLEDQLGQIHPVQPAALEALFEQFADHVICVVLNACYSQTQAAAIAKHVNHVIGMREAIGDRAAIAFTVGFYQALGAGPTIESAYKLGCVQIRLQGIPEHLTPVLIKRVPATLREATP